MENDSKLQDLSCFRCSKQKTFSYNLTAFVLLTMLISFSYAMCPNKCSCNDEDLFTSCSYANLQVVPIQLNPELKHINLSNNKINNIHFTLDIYANLIILDISHNKIQKLGSNNFISQNNLEKLKLNNNEIEELDKDVFKGLKHLLYLDVSFNKIEEISPYSFIDLTLLEILFINNNKIISFESELFKHQKYLRILQIDDNQLLEIPVENLIFTVNLEELYLSRNLIEYVEEDSLPMLKKLKLLSLESNVISEIHENAFDGFISLENLNLADNNFTNVPTNQLSKLSNLSDLSLSRNFFTVIPPVAFKGLFKLQKLYLNGIETLVKIDFRSFVDNINLEFVSLNDNIDLKSIPTRLFHGNPKIKHISIKNNNLQTLEASHFPLDQLKSLQIGGNPLECNCSLIWLWKLIKEQKSINLESNETLDQLLDIDAIKCANPEHLSGILLANVQEYDIKCSLNWIAVTTVSCTVVFVLVILCIAVIYTGLFQKCTKEKTYIRRTNIDAPFQPDSSSSNAQRSKDKCEHIGPPLLSEYQTLPPWEYSGSSMYKHYTFRAPNGHDSKPHIVYV